MKSLNCLLVSRLMFRFFRNAQGEHGWGFPMTCGSGIDHKDIVANVKYSKFANCSRRDEIGKYQSTGWIAQVLDCFGRLSPRDECQDPTCWFGR